jgi:hypothetical protein
VIAITLGSETNTLAPSCDNCCPPVRRKHPSARESDLAIVAALLSGPPSIPRAGRKLHRAVVEGVTMVARYDDNPTRCASGMEERRELSKTLGRPSQIELVAS